MSKPDGGPAFPEGVSMGASGDIITSTGHGYSGMTLRDWFAGQTAAGLTVVLTIATTAALEEAARADGFGGTLTQYVAFRAYALADAMLAERLKD